MSEQFETRHARFAPKRVNNLSSIAPPIGWEGEWFAAWVHDEGDYAGQMVWTALETPAHFGWVPEEDLEFFEDIAGSTR